MPYILQDSHLISYLIFYANWKGLAFHTHVCVKLDFFNNLGKILSESTDFIVERIKREKIERILNELINPNKKYNERIDIKNKISWLIKKKQNFMEGDI